jgi:hypothetical protein
MIENFETITSELNEDELYLIPYLISGFEKRTVSNPIKAPEIVKAMNLHFKDKIKSKFSDVRLRKCVNYIRVNSLLPLIATSKGYYCSWDKKEIASQINSLEQRARSINDCANGLKKFLK